MSNTNTGGPAFPAAPVQPVVWKWHQAPVKTSWGHDMVVADLAIDKDNTVSVYCERDQTTKVEAMFFTPPAAPVYVKTFHGNKPWPLHPEPPPECQTEAEKTAFAFGWWKALEVNRYKDRVK